MRKYSFCMEETFIINELKNLILQKTGIRTVTPSDCKRISMEISRSVKKTVSETTIKRLYGFAVVKHNFSRFTLTTLLEYVGKEDLTKLLPKHPSLPQRHDAQDNWTAIDINAMRITQSTIKGIKHRSGLPYHMTIERKFAEQDFDDFYKSDCAFTCFISQPGYGRTILLSHLAEKYFLAPNAPYQKCTLLFINATNLFNNEYKTFSLDEQLKFQLGISPQDGIIPFVNNHFNNREEKFIIFMDGFSELTLKRDLKFQLFESIINLISAIEDSKNIKLVMSMRSTTWLRFFERMRSSIHLRSKWYMGNYFNQNDTANVPPLTEKEVDQIILKINNHDAKPIHPKLKSQLKYPYHFQLYYQLKEEDPNFDYSANISFYELITKYIQEKIYRSNYYTEKILFLKKLVQMTDFAKSGSFVAKDNLINELGTFKNAYMELISDGILTEEKHTETMHPVEYVRFLQQHIFEYFLFIELLEKHHLKLDRSFFDKIKAEYEGTKVYFSILQWSIRFVIRIGDLKPLNFIFDLKFTNSERNQIILFIAENLKYRLSYSMEILLLLQQHKFHNAAVVHILNFDFLDTAYKDSIYALLDIADTNENKLIYNAVLSIIETLKLNPATLDSRLKQLEPLKEAGSSWFISPHDFTSLVYQKLNDVQINQHPVSQKIDLFKQNHEIFPVKGDTIGVQEAIIYMYMCVINTLYGNSVELIKIIRSILKVRPNFFHIRSPFSTHILSLLAIACARTSPGKKTDQMEIIVGKLLEDDKKGYFTHNVHALYKILQAEQYKNKNENQLALNKALESLQFFTQKDLYLNCLIVYNLIIKICTKMQDFEKATEYKYEKFNFMEERNIHKQLFPFSITSHHNS